MINMSTLEQKRFLYDTIPTLSSGSVAILAKIVMDLKSDEDVFFNTLTDEDFARIEKIGEDMANGEYVLLEDIS